MWPGHIGWDGWGMFPLIMPFFMIVVVVAVLYLLFGRRSGQGHESALDILKKRYARGEINQEDFERIKKDILS